MRIKSKTKDCHLVVKVKTAFGENVDEKELDRFARVYLRGFLKPNLKKRNLIEYTGPVAISMYERLKKPVTKRDFFFIIEHIVVAVQKLQANNFPVFSLATNLQNVYINEVTKEVQFLYIPMATGSANCDIVTFIQSIIYSANPMQENDMDYIARFAYFLNNMRNFDVEKIEDYIVGEDRSVVNIIKKQNDGQSGFMTNKWRHYYEHYEKKQEKAEEDEATGILGEEEEATCRLIEDEDEATGILGEEEATGLLEEEGTALLIEENPSIHYPILFRVLTEEKISVNKPVFRIGKERSYVDYFVANNNAISRSHADIVTRGNKYFVIDLNSKNHTYINNQALQVQCEVEIYDGDTLKLGNEEFIFHI